MLMYWIERTSLQWMYSSEQLDSDGSVIWSGCQKKEYPTIFCTGSLSMAKGQEACPAKTGCPVSLRMQLSLQVSLTSLWKLQNNKQQIGYSGGVSYVEKRSFYAAQATPTTRRRPFQVQVSKIQCWSCIPIYRFYLNGTTHIIPLTSIQNYNRYSIQLNLYLFKYSHFKVLVYIVASRSVSKLDISK